MRGRGVSPDLLTDIITHLKEYEKNKFWRNVLVGNDYYVRGKKARRYIKYFTDVIVALCTCKHCAKIMEEVEECR